MEPGVEPPTSEWWAREATYPNNRPSPACTGDRRVMSGRWVPPRKGSFRQTTSPAASSPSSSSAASTLMGMAPRCTGMWSPSETASPRGLNSAQE